MLQKLLPTLRQQFVATDVNEHIMNLNLIQWCTRRHLVIQALALYREYQQMYDKCRQLYIRKHGPLNHGMPSESEGYSWLDDPWPWEYCGNKEA